MSLSDNIVILIIAMVEIQPTLCSTFPAGSVAIQEYLLLFLKFPNYPSPSI